jgi:hypothetical protein
MSYQTREAAIATSAKTVESMVLLRSSTPEPHLIDPQSTPIACVKTEIVILVAAEYATLSPVRSRSTRGGLNFKELFLSLRVLAACYLVVFVPASNCALARRHAFRVVHYITTYSLLVSD